MKKASLYLRRPHLFLHPMSCTTDGVWIAGAPEIKLDESSGDEELGRALAEALMGSASGVPHPRVWSGRNDAFLKLAGVKSWATFARTAEHASAEEIDGVTCVIPYVNRGASEGFQPLPEQAVAVRPVTFAALGAAAREALRRSAAN
jgi:hypothetical protein